MRGTLVALLGAVALAACASEGQRAARQRVETWPHAAAAADPAPEAQAEAVRAAEVDGTLAGWLAAARANHPRLEAQFFRWKRAVLAVSRAQRWPEPSIGYTAFVATGMMPVTMQRHQLVVRQEIPWLSRFGHAEDRDLLLAQAEEQTLHGMTREVERGVEEAYFALWRARQLQGLIAEQREILRGITETLDARIRTGGSDLAEVQLAKVGLMRLDDRLRQAESEEAMAIARLKEATGVFDAAAYPTAEGPEATAPAYRVDALVAEAREARIRRHPQLAARRLKVQAMEAELEVERTEAYPMFGVEAGWTEMSPGAEPRLGTGADMLMFGLMIRVPLWQRSYADAVDALRAGIRAEESEERELALRMRAVMEEALAALADAERREALFTEGVIPTTEVALSSVLGALAAGRASPVEVLRMQRELLAAREDALDAAVAAALARSTLAFVAGPSEGDEERDDD